MTAGRLEQLRSSHALPGLAVGIASWKSGSRSLISGERRRGSGAVIAEGDLWQVASCSKSFTATLIGRLVDKGAMRWDDTVGDVLGEAAPKMRDDYRRASVLHLLSHRAGVVRNVSAWGYGFEEDKGPRDRLATVRSALGQKPMGPLGAETYVYSNAGYQVAAAMAEARTGKSYEDLMRAEVFGPLGLSSAMFRESAAQTLRKGGPDQMQGHPPQNDGGAASNPAGGIALTLGDFLAYLAAHRDETAHLKPETWRALHTDPFGHDYALGWHIEDAGAGGLIHGGSLSGWMAKAWINKTRGIAAAAITNGRHRQGEALLAQCIYEAAG